MDNIKGIIYDIDPSNVNDTIILYGNDLFLEYLVLKHEV